MYKELNGGYTASVVKVSAGGHQCWLVGTCLFFISHAHPFIAMSNFKACIHVTGYESYTLTLHNNLLHGSDGTNLPV